MDSKPIYENDLVPELMSLIAPPKAPNFSGQGEDWCNVESELGFKLPSDYKKIINHYGYGIFNDELRIYNPFSPETHNLIKEYKWFRNNDPFFTKKNLVPVAHDIQQDYIFWDVTGDGSVGELVALSASKTIEERYELSLSEFLLGLLKGDIACEAVSEDFVEERSFVVE